MVYATEFLCVTLWPLKYIDSSTCFWIRSRDVYFVILAVYILTVSLGRGIDCFRYVFFFFIYSDLIIVYEAALHTCMQLFFGLGLNNIQIAEAINEK